MRDPDQLVLIYGMHDVQTPQRYRYVGLTTKRLRDRLGQHRRGSRKGTSDPVPAWIREIGEDRVAMTLLEECVWSNRHAREAFWILEKETLRERWPDGLNDSLGAMLSYRQRLFISDGNRLAWANPARAAERSANVSASRSTPEQRQLSSRYMKLLRADPAKKEMFSEIARQAGLWSTHLRYHEAHGVRRAGCIHCGVPAEPEPFRIEGVNPNNHNRWHAGRGVISKNCEYCAAIGCTSTYFYGTVISSGHGYTAQSP